MIKNIKIFGLVFIAFFGLFMGAPEVYARTVTTCSSAILKGSVSSTRNNPTTVWFEWGRGSRENSSSYPNATYSQTMTRSGSFEEMITGLTSSTTYYYRALAQNDDGLTVGDIETFKTGECETKTITKTVVRYVPVPTPAPTPRPTARVYVQPNVQPAQSDYIGQQAYNSQNGLRANAFDSVSGIPFNLIQIFLFLIFILGIVFLAKKIFSQPSH